MGGARTFSGEQTSLSGDVFIYLSPRLVGGFETLVISIFRGLQLYWYDCPPFHLFSSVVISKGLESPQMLNVVLWVRPLFSSVRRTYFSSE